MKTSESTAKIIPKFVKVKALLKQPKKTSKGYGYTYANLPTVQEAIDDAIKQAKADIFYTQNTINDEKTGFPSTTTRIFDSSGEWLEFGPLTLPVAKNNAQGFGSAITYERRYQLSEAFGIASEEDDDGNGAIGGNKQQNRQQSVRQPQQNYQQRQPQQNYQRNYSNNYQRR